MLGWIGDIQGWQIQPSIPAPLLLKAYTNARPALEMVFGLPQVLELTASGIQSSQVSCPFDEFRNLSHLSPAFLDAAGLKSTTSHHSSSPTSLGCYLSGISGI